MLGDAFIVISPNSDKFKSQLLAQLKKAMAGVSSDVPVTPDTADFRAEAAAKIKAALAGLNPSVPVGMDLTGTAALRAKIESAIAGLNPDVKVGIDAPSAAAAAAKVEAALAGLHPDIPVGIDIGEAAAAIAVLRTLMRNLGLADFLDIDVAPGKIVSQLQLLKRKMAQEGIADLLEVNLNQSQLGQQLAKLSHVTEEIPVDFDTTKLPEEMHVAADVTNAAQDAADALLLAATKTLTEATIMLNVTTAPLIPATYLLIGATDELTKATMALTAATRAEREGSSSAAAAEPVPGEAPVVTGVREDIDVTASTAQAQAAVAALQAKLAMLSDKLTDLRIGADDASALATIAALQAKVAVLTEATKKILFAADTTRLDAAIAAEQAKIVALTQKVSDLKMDADTTAATAKIAALEKQIADMYASLDKLEEKGVDLDINAMLTKIYAAEAQLKVLQADAGSTRLGANATALNAAIAASTAKVEALKSQAADIMIGGGINSTALAKAEAQTLALEAAVAKLAPVEEEAAAAASTTAAGLTGAGGAATTLTGKLLALDVELAAKRDALEGTGMSASVASAGLKAFATAAMRSAGSAKAAASADNDATTSLLGAAVGAQRAGMSMTGLIGAFRDTAGIAGWAGIIHSVFMLTMEYLAVAIPGTVALGAAVAVQVQAWGDMYTRVSAMYTVSEALGNSFHDTTGQMLGLTDSLQAAQNAMQTKTYELFGAAINGVKQDMSNANGMGHLFIQMGEQVTEVLDQFAAKIDVDLNSGMGQFTGLLSKGVADLTEFGQILGNIGHSILDFASDMPGLAEVILKVVDGLSQLLLWVSKLPPMLITVVMAIEEAYRWSGYLAAIFGVLGKGIELLGTLGLPIIAAIGKNIAAMFAGIIAGASGAVLNLGMIAEKLPVVGDAIAGVATSVAGGLEGIATFLAGPWGIAIGLAVGALVTLGLWLSNTKTETQQWVDGLESAIKSAAGLAQIGSTYQDLSQVSVALGKAQSQVAAGQTSVASSAGQVSQALNAVNKAGSGNLQVFSQYLKTLSAASAAQDKANASIASASQKIPTLTAAQKQLNADWNTEIGNVQQLSKAYGITYVQAAILAGDAGANLTQTMKGNSTAAQENLQMVKNYVAGLGGMGAVQGQLGADVNAVTIDAALQSTQVSKLTTAWTDVMNMVQAPSSGFLSLAQSLVQYTADAQAAGATTTGLGGKIGATATKVSTASITLQQDFNAAASAAQTMLNSLYVTSTVTGSNGLLIQGIKDTIAVLIPLAGTNQAAAAQIQVLAQEANLGGMTLPELAKAVSGTKDPLTDLYNISQKAATELSNLGNDAANLASVIQSSLNQTLVAAAEQLTGVSAKTATYLTDLQNLGAGSPVTQAALNNLNGSIAEANVLSGQAASGITALTGKVQDQGTTTAAQQANRQTLLTDITAIITKAPDATTAIQELITKVQQQGSTTASEHGARQTLINDLVAMHVPLQTAITLVDNLIGAIGKIPASKSFTLTETGTGTFSIRDISSTGNVGGVGGHTSPTAAAGMLVQQGTTPTADDVLIRVSKGETVVSAADSKLLAPAFKALGIPGYAAGGAIGSSAAALAPETTSWNANFQNTMTAAMEAAMSGAMKTAEAAAEKAAAAVAGGASGGTTTGGRMTAAQIEALWISLGGNPAAAANMAAIAMAESSDDPSIVQAGEPPGLTGYGLFQITPTSGITQNGQFGNLLNATNNTKAAIALFNADGYAPWSSDPVGAGLSGLAMGGMIPGYATGGLIPGYATGSIIPPGKAMAAAQAKELADYAAAVKGVKAAVAKAAASSALAKNSASVTKDLSYLAKDQNFEVSAYNQLKSKGLTAGNLSYFRDQLGWLSGDAKDYYLTLADSSAMATIAGIVKTLDAFAASTSAASAGSSTAAKTSKSKSDATLGAAYLKAWKTSAGTINNQIAQETKQLSKDKTLAGAKGLSKSLAAKYKAAAAADQKKLNALNTELGVMRDWRSELSSSDSSLSSWISAAGSTPVLAKNVTAWKKQLASQKATIAKISFMLGPTAAQLAAAAAAAGAAAGSTASSGAGSTVSSGAGSTASSGAGSTASSSPGVTISPEQALQLLNLASSVGGAPSGMMPSSGLPAPVPGAAAWFDNGGVITEPILGRGMRSGQLYGFGGSGPETVVPGTAKTSGASLDDVTCLLRELVTATKQVPAQTGTNFGRALNGTARQAGLSGQYTTRRLPP